MKIEKKVISHLNKCYAIAKLTYHQEDCFLVAAEKHDPCYLFRADGSYLETVWDGPGGVMTMEQIPDSDGVFLATHEFYSPNDAAKARIVIASPSETGWNIQTLCEAPFVHRFGILSRNGVKYLIVCCLKSGHAYKDDWRFAGVTYGTVLPNNLDNIDDVTPLKLSPLMEGMLKNHGFSKYVQDGVQTAVVACDNGVYQFVPPAMPDETWEIRRIISGPSSDAVLIDFDGDGEPELGSIAPFHGDTLRIYKKSPEGVYAPVWEYPEKCEFLHATWAGELFGKPAWYVGSRKGDRKSMVITYHNGYTAEIFDTGAGAANAMLLDTDKLVMTNREVDEIAVYSFLRSETHD